MNEAEVLELVDAGCKLGAIAKALRLPLPAVHRIVHGRGSHTRPAVVKDCGICGQRTATRGGPSILCDSCRRRHSKAGTAASLAVRHAIARGELPPAKNRMCVDCDNAATDYDHRDYSKPLAVDPVCRSCNIRRGMAKTVRPADRR